METEKSRIDARELELLGTHSLSCQNKNNKIKRQRQRNKWRQMEKKAK